MQLMLTLFGRVLYVSVGIDRAEGEAQLVCVTSGDFELAGEGETEDAQRQIGFGKQTWR